MNWKTLTLQHAFLLTLSKFNLNDYRSLIIKRHLTNTRFHSLQTSSWSQIVWMERIVAIIDTHVQTYAQLKQRASLIIRISYSATGRWCTSRTRSTASAAPRPVQPCLLAEAIDSRGVFPKWRDDRQCGESGRLTGGFYCYTPHRFFPKTLERFFRKSPAPHDCQVTTMS